MKQAKTGSIVALVVWLFSSVVIHTLFGAALLLEDSSSHAAHVERSSNGVPLDFSLVGDSDEQHDDDKPWEGGEEQKEDSLPEGIAVSGREALESVESLAKTKSQKRRKPSDVPAPSASPSVSAEPSDVIAPPADNSSEGDSASEGEPGEQEREPSKTKVPNVLGALGLGVDKATHRKLLGDAAECPDKVTGTWIAKRFSKRYGDWARFTLKIKQDGTKLSGKILSRMWSGGVFDSTPPPCRPGRTDTTVLMPAKGSLHGDVFDLKAKTYRRIRTVCRGGIFSYLPDHFSGKLVGETLRVTNNDGGREINVPYRFHRTSCGI